MKPKLVALILIILVVFSFGLYYFFFSFKDRPVTFATLASTVSGRGLSEAQIITINNYDDLDKLWRQIFINQPDAPRAPATDFVRFMSLGLFAGEKPTAGYDYDVDYIVEKKNRLEIYMLERKPGSDCLSAQVITTPFRLITFPATDKKIIIKDVKEIIQNCSPTNTFNPQNHPPLPPL